jgi:hypothetical protein
MKKLLIKISILSLFGIFGVVGLAQMNYQQAVAKAREVDTESEIKSVFEDHGFDSGIYDKITVSEKVKAFFTVIIL